MKKIVIKTFSCCAFLAVALMMQSWMAGNQTMTKENGMTVINTTTLGKDVQGYMGTTPLKIYIEKNKVVKIEALKNQETPKYFSKVKKALLEKWNGLKVKEVVIPYRDRPEGSVSKLSTVKDGIKVLKMIAKLRSNY